MKKRIQMLLQILAVLLISFGIISQNLTMTAEASGCREYCPCGPMNCAVNDCYWGFVLSSNGSFSINGSCGGHRTFLNDTYETGRSTSVSSYDSDGVRYFTETTTIYYRISMGCELCRGTSSATTYQNSYRRWSETIIPPQDLSLKMNKPSNMSSTITKSDAYISNGIQYYTKNSNNVSTYVPAATGWSFNGFYTASSGGTQVYDGAGKNVSASGYWTDKYPSGYLSYKTQSPLTVYAHWSPNTYTIIYDLAGGNYGTNHPSSATYDTAFTVNNPTRDGYTFKGWKIEGMDSVTHTYGGSTTTATSISGTTATSFKNLRSTSGNVKFTAVWEGISVKLYGNGNKPSNMSSRIYNGSSTTFNSVASQEIKDMSPYQKGYFTNITTLSATGWTFNGWYYGNTLLYNSSGVPQKNVPSNDKIFIDYDFYTFGTSSNATTGNVNYTVGDKKTYTANWQIDSWSGSCSIGHSGCSYAVRWWWCNGCGRGDNPGHGGAQWSSCPVCGTFGSYPSGGQAHSCEQDTSTTKIAGTITITRSGNTLTASYTDKADNANNISEVSYVWKNSSGTQVGTGNSYTFTAAGTYSVTISGTCESKPATGSASIGVTYIKDPATVFTKSSAVTVYASWTPNTYSITYNLDGGSHGASHPTSATYDTAFTVDNPTKNGYIFKGWTISGMDSVNHTIGTFCYSTTSKTEVKATNFMNLRSSAGTVTFTAVWEKTDYILKVNGNRPSGMDPLVIISYEYYGSSTQGLNNADFHNINDFRWKETGSYQTVTYTDGSTAQLPVMTQSVLNLSAGTTNHNNIGYCKADGYTFGGWNDAASGSLSYGSNGSYNSADTAHWTSDGKFIGNGNPNSNEFNVRAKWTPITYNISYQLVGGSWSGVDPTTSVAFDSELNVGHPIRTGYTFMGWKIENYQTEYAYVNGVRKTTSTWTSETATSFKNLRYTPGTVTFTAIWKPLEFDLYIYTNKPSTMSSTIKDVNGNTAPSVVDTTANSVKLAYDSTNYGDISSCLISAIGYDFNGWYSSATGGTQIYDNLGKNVKATGIWSDNYPSGVYKGLGNLKVYAKWTVHSYTISYDLNDISSLSNPVFGTSHPTSIKYDETFKVDNPTMTGFIFKGWEISGMDSNTHKYGTTDSVSTSSTATSFGSSTIGTSNKYFKNLTATNNATITFKAIWQATETTVTLDTNKSSYSSMSSTPSLTKSSYTMTYNKNDGNSINIPTVTGWRFLGWYTAKTGGTKVFDNTGKNLSGNDYWSNAYSSGLWKYTGNSVTFYAHWEPITYKVRYELNGGTVSGTNPTTITYDQQFNVNYQPALDGANFIGWDITGYNTSTAKYGSGNTSKTTTPWNTTATIFKNLQSTQDAEVVFAARYEDTELRYDVGQGDSKLVFKTASGLTYTPGNWTAETVIITYSQKDLSGLTKIYLKDSSGEPMDIKTNIAPKTWASVTIDYPETGIYSGDVYGEDKAATATNNGLKPRSKNNSYLQSYINIMVDKKIPDADVSYTPDSSVGYNGDVKITITASDDHSGLHNTAYRWSYLNDNGTYTTGSWVNVNNQTVYYNRKGYVEVRDAVGNIRKVDFEVNWIDKQSVYANVSASGKKADGSAITTGIALAPQNKITTGPLSVGYINAIYESGLKMNAWSVTDVTLRLSLLDKAYSNKLIASGFGSIVANDVYRQYVNNAYSTKSSVTMTKSDNNSNIPSAGYTGYDYIIGEGYHWITTDFKDAAGISTKQTIGIKVDKTAPTVDITRCTRYTHLLSDFSSNELLTMATNGTMVDTFATQFHFEVNDKSATANSATGRYTEGSGIAKVVLTIYDCKNDAITKDYVLSASGYQTITAYCDTIEKGIYSATYDCAINTYTEFPTSTMLGYKLTVTDNAGLETIATWDRIITNIQIRADILSSVDEEFNTFEDPDYIAYFKTGDLGYVDIWTLGYVTSVQFDFGNIGSEAMQEIKDGNLLEKYNLGVPGVSGYDRIISISKATGYDCGLAKVGGVSFVSHLVSPNEYQSNGTGIRIPLLLDINDYVYCTADFIAKRDGYEAKDTAGYYIYDNANTSLHWRVTHE